MAHELGHNLGLGHASLWQVASDKSDPLDASGSKVEYGHAYDIMGQIRADSESRNGFQAASLHYLGWLPEGAVETIETSGRFRIYQFDRADTDLNQRLAVRIPLEGNDAYWFSYRHRYLELRKGLMVEKVDEAARTSLLLDMVPGGYLLDSALKQDRAFTDDGLGVVARVVAAGGGEDPWVDFEVAYVARVAFNQVDVRNGAKIK